MSKILYVLVLFIGIGVGVAGMMFAPFGGEKESNSATVAGSVSEETASTTEEAPPADAPSYKVMHIVDGDTIAIEKDGKKESVRLIGVDTPELHDSRTGVQCFAKDAALETARLLEGKRVRLEIDESQDERDKYRRLLAYIFREDGVFVNRQLIADGFAHEYTYDEAYKYQDAFKEAEESAREGEKGLWAPDACSEPPVKRPSASKSSNAQSQVAGASTAIEPPRSSIPQPAPATTSTEMPKEPVKQPVQKEKVEEEPEEKLVAKKSGDYVCSTNTYNCTDFKTQSEAQAAYEACGGVDNDIHKLDKNKDGQACDSLR